MDLTNKEDSLSKEQESLDDHDDLIVDLAVCIKQLISMCMASDTTPRNVAALRLAHIQKALSEISMIATLTGETDNEYKLRQFEEQLVDFKEGTL